MVPAGWPRRADETGQYYIKELRMSKGTSEEWRALQQRYAAAADNLRQFGIDMSVKYGQYAYVCMSRRESDKEDKLRKAESRAMDRIMTWLDKHGSPRNWHTTLPCSFICRE